MWIRTYKEMHMEIYARAYNLFFNNKIRNGNIINKKELFTNMIRYHLKIQPNEPIFD